MSDPPIARQPTTAINTALRTPKRVHSALCLIGPLSIEFTLPLTLVLVLKYGRRPATAVDFAAAWQEYEHKRMQVPASARANPVYHMTITDLRYRIVTEIRASVTVVTIVATFSPSVLLRFSASRARPHAPRP